MTRDERKGTGLRGVAAAGLAMGWACAAMAQSPATNSPAAGVTIVQRLGAEVPADLRFVDDAGGEVSIGSYFGSRPVVLALVYYRCPMLCNQMLDGLVAALKRVELMPGRDFEVVAVSIDPRETPELAAAKKRSYVKAYGRGSEAGWHFLTGDAGAIGVLAEQVGYQFRYDERTDQYVHASGLQIIAPGGRVSRYFYGVRYPPDEMQSALADASLGRTGPVAPQVFLYCFTYDPLTGRYGLLIMNVLRLGCVATVLALGFFIGRSFYLGRRPRSGVAEAVARGGADR